MPRRRQQEDPRSEFGSAVHQGVWSRSGGKKGVKARGNTSFLNRLFGKRYRASGGGQTSRMSEDERMEQLTSWFGSEAHKQHLKKLAEERENRRRGLRTRTTTRRR